MENAPLDLVAHTIRIGLPHPEEEKQWYGESQEFQRFKYALICSKPMYEESYYGNKAVEWYRLAITPTTKAKGRTSR